MSKNAAKCCKMCLPSAKIRTRTRAIALQRVLNILRHLLASFVWFLVSLVAILFPLYLSIGIFGRRFRVILLFFNFFSEKSVFFSLFLSNSRKIWEKCAEMMKRRPSPNEDERISRAWFGRQPWKCILMFATPARFASWERLPCLNVSASVVCVWQLETHHV